MQVFVTGIGLLQQRLAVVGRDFTDAVVLRNVGLDGGWSRTVEAQSLTPANGNKTNEWDETGGTDSKRKFYSFVNF